MATINETGVVTESLAVKKQDLERRFRDMFGDDLSLDPETPQGQVIGLMALVRAEIDETFTQLAAGLSVATAQGTQLDDLGSLLGVVRLAAVHSRVTCRLTGVAGTNVPAGSRAKTSDDVQWRSVEDAILSPSGVDVEFEAVDSGPFTAGAGTITILVTVISGWETITNAQDSTTGISRQTDDEYRRTLQARTGRSATASLPAIESSLYESGATKIKVLENITDADVIVQQYTIHANSILCIVQGGSDADIARAILTHRGLGVGVTVAILGRTIVATDEAALAAVSSGSITFDGTAYPGLDLTSDTDNDGYAASLATLLDTPGVAVHFEWASSGYFVAAFRWKQGDAKVFSGTVAGNYGLVAGAAVYAGPFIRPRERELDVTATVAVRPGFPADGLAKIRTAIFTRVGQYEIGEQIWENDILSAIEFVTGTRVTALSVQEAGRDISGVAVPLDVAWTLPAANLTITLTGI